MRAAILGLFFAACGGAPPPPPVWPAPVSTAYRATEPFHVVVHAVEATGLNPMRFWLCPIEGATFLCGDDLYVARGGRIERDPDLERGLPRDSGVMKVAGRWPDDAWLVTGGKESRSHVAYRWRGDRWSKVAALPGWDWSQPIAVWRGQLFVLQQQPVNPPKPPRLAVYSSDQISRLVRQLVACATCKDENYSWHGALAASVSTLFVVEAGCGKMNRGLTRVTETGMTTVTLPEATDLAVVASDRGAMIFGGTSQYEARVLGRVDAAWAPVDVPGGGQITSYAKAPDGTEWIGVHHEPGDHRGKVFARAAGASWQPVDWQSATAAYGTSPQLDHLWIAEGSVWITTFVDGVCHDTKGCLYRSLLLRTGSKAPSLSLTPRIPQSAANVQSELLALSCRPMLDARNPDLEAAITANPLDRDPYLVFADWLQQQGDPRGELVSLQLAGKDEAAEALLAKHEDYFLGPLAEHKLVYDEGGNNSVSSLRTPEQEAAWQQIHTQAFRWRNGFIHFLRLSHDEDQQPKKFEGTLAEILDQVLDHPSGRFIVEVAFHGNGNLNDDNLQPLIDTLAEKAPATLRKLTLGDNIDQISWHHVGSLAALWPSVSHLKTLEIETGELEVGEPGQMIAPALERAIFITGGMSPSCARGIATAQIPAIQHLEIYYGDPNYGGNATIDDVKPLLDRSDLTQLRYLGLKNSMFANDLARLVGSAKVIKNLDTLDLSLGAMTDEGAKLLAESAAGLAHLKTLNLKRNFLTAAGIELVKNLCPTVLTDGQEKPYERGNGELRYFVSVAE